MSARFAPKSSRCESFPDHLAIIPSGFQCLSAVYTVLSDESRRGLYDESGEVCEKMFSCGILRFPEKKVEDESDPLSDPNKDWVDYWRNLFPKVTTLKHGRFW